MIQWLMAHKVLVLLGIGVAGAAFFVLRQGGSPSGSSGGIGGANPGNQTNTADPINAQLTGLQEQLSNMMAAISSKLSSLTPGASVTPAAPAAPGAPATPAPRTSVPVSVVTPLPVSGDPWQPPVAAATTAPTLAVVTVAPAAAAPVPGGYLGTSLGEKQYAKPAAAAPPPAPVYRPAPVPVYHPTPAQSSSAYAGVSLGEGQYIKTAPAAAPAPAESVTHGKLTSF